MFWEEGEQGLSCFPCQVLRSLFASCRFLVLDLVSWLLPRAELVLWWILNTELGSGSAVVSAELVSVQDSFFPPQKYSVLQLYVLNFMCPLTPDRLQFSQPVLVLRQLLISGQLPHLPPHPFSRLFTKDWSAEVTAQTQTPTEGHCYHAAIWELAVFSWPPFPVFQPIVCR